MRIKPRRTLVTTNSCTALPATQVHGAGMTLIPLIYGGNTDYGTFLGDSNAQSTFITWLVTEAQTNAYDGWNIDWEPNSINSTQYVSFLTAAKAALHAKNLILTVDIGGWYIEQCGADGIDLTQIGPAVDVAIIEDYAGGEGTAPTTCTGAPSGMVNCDPDPTSYFGDLSDAMGSGISDAAAERFAAMMEQALDLGDEAGEVLGRGAVEDR